ncbi:MAG: leucine-rich repeat domain-containing protein [Caldilineaceae bacterium]|nr:leucine-rich repeat domain-containing protein [Caldilineaceae bacterium]
MKLSAKTAAVKARSILFPSALLFVLIPILFYTEITRAQSETGQTLNAPVLTVTAAGENTVELSWNTVSGAARYELWAWTRAGGWERLDEGDLTGTSYVHIGLTAGTTYYYTVRTVDASGAPSAWSEYARATMPEARLATATPTSTQPPSSGPTPTPTATASTSVLAIPQLTAQSTESGVVLTWEAVPQAVRYELLKWWDAATGWQSLGGDNLTDTTYTHTVVKAGTTYFYSIRALNAAGEASGWLLDYPFATALAATGGATSTPTSTFAATPTPTQTPTSALENKSTPTPTSTPTATASAPEPGIPQLTARATESGVLLSWKTVPNAVRYELLAWWNAGTGWHSLGGDSLTGTTFTHANVIPGTTYYYSIRALNAAGEVSGWLLDYPFATALPATATATPSPTVTTTAVTERGALIALYEATDGANWTHNDNWLTDKPLSTWYGVTTDFSGHVYALELENNNLTGPLTELNAFINLSVLNLSHNTNLTGPIPDLSALVNLTVLNLSSNTNLTGPIPDLSALVKLTVLNLGYSENLTGPFPDLSALVNLTVLSLGHNRNLAGPLPDVSALADLITLNLRDNQMTGQISDLRLPAKVQNVYLDHNRLTGPIPDLSALSHLNLLYLRDNQLTGAIPSTLGNHPYLGELDLRDNQLTGTIPTTLGHLLSLNNLYLSGNTLSGCIPAELRIVRRSDLECLGMPYCAPAPTATPTPGATPTPATTDKGALIALYHATDGANWKRNNNWLTDKPIDLWYGVTANSNGRVTQLRLQNNGLEGTIPALSALPNLTHLDLGYNNLSGSIPDLSALPNLTHLDLGFNWLSGSIPDLGALSNLTFLQFRSNRLTGRIPDLSALTNLKELRLSHNALTGPIPDLSALTSLGGMDLSYNGLTGPSPVLSDLTSLRYLNLSSNELSGLLLDLHTLINLESLVLSNNDFSGPVPDLSALVNLRVLRLWGNRLCLPAGAVLSHPHSFVDGILKSLNPPACTEPDFSRPLEAPRNLTAIVGASQVTLTWEAVPNAASYDLWVWDSLDRRWDPLGDALTDTTYTHSVLTDGRNYYYQARARDAAGMRGPWSARGQAIVVTQRYPPPPASLGLDLFYQKYLKVAGVVVVAPSEVSDGKLDQVREVVTAIFSGRPAFFEELSANRLRIVIFKPNELDEYIVQLPELWNHRRNYHGIAIPTATGWAAVTPEDDRTCYILIHEFAHIIQFALEDQLDGQEFKARVTALYNAALDAGLWRSAYAATNAREYWAETVAYWFREYTFRPEETRGKKLEDYDPEIARLIAETFGEGAYVPEYCKP